MAPVQPHFAPVQRAFSSYFREDLLRPLQSTWATLADLTSAPGGLVCKKREFTSPGQGLVHPFSGFPARPVSHPPLWTHLKHFRSTCKASATLGETHIDASLYIHAKHSEETCSMALSKAIGHGISENFWNLTPLWHRSAYIPLALTYCPRQQNLYRMNVSVIVLQDGYAMFSSRQMLCRKYSVIELNRF